MFIVYHNNTKTSTMASIESSLNQINMDFKRTIYPLKQEKK